MLTSWTSISTTSTPEGRAFEIPSSVLQTAAIPSSANGSIDLNWSAPDTSTIFFVVLHFAEIQVLQTNSLREFYIYANGELFFKDPVPLSNTIGSYAWDLSNNNLSGNIPDSLDQLVSLTYFFNSKPHGTGHRNSSKAVIIVAVVAVFPILGAAALFLYLIMKMKEIYINPPTDNEDTGNFGMACFSKVTENQEDSTASEAGIKELNINKRKFSFAELKDVTNNFRDEIGGGGFGKVFKGRLEDGNEVAVKVRSDELSSQGIEQFLNEVDKLSRVHHKNLVSLMGYCIDGDHIALVYEHMEKGNLQQWIGGCQYLHKMCTPPLIHRDIKSNNILLTANLEAKVSDFGSARECSGTHVTTQIIGTLGYLDPYYASTAELTEKSDVYSFGVVLLEIVTGKSPIIKGPEGNYNLTQFVQERLSKGNIESILDPNMRGQYNINSIWKVAELALRCTDSPVRRPDMTEIVRELEETMNLEVSCIDTSKVASEDISRYTIGGEVHDGNFNMAHTGGMRQPDYGPSAR
ncbi:hypothetical protein LUZ61_021141 [Rhynchospora tenuis]|uniref:Protein kinase domain-containing protein n=1 Tax=Rhynchospora tenuis TaxID=198213 RepID=A0AAD5Z1C6_9POAL|nr:hypothetical protein LUZ61_021141 [Rhynchospora tenuis]